jgi:hypothetical protein
MLPVDVRPVTDGAQAPANAGVGPLAECTRTAIATSTHMRILMAIRRTINAAL